MTRWDHMKLLLFTAGAILALAGTTFMLQGMGFIYGSFMTSQPRWIYIGLGLDVVAVAFWILAASQRKKHTP
jgi:ABC-type anion transport system duplicated permease subunit